MGDETSDAMNLDLNLSPGPEPISGSMTHVPINMDTWEDSQLRRMREAVRIGARQRSRWRRFHLTPESVSMELNHLMVNSGTSTTTTLQAGEGSVDPEERTSGELTKTGDENNKNSNSKNGFSKLDDSESKRAEAERCNDGNGSFFDCNICLDLAKSPVVTCCGHLFCWPCLYRWLHFHSDAKECPVCKGEVTFKNVTPIYGRGGTGSHKVGETEEDEDSSLKVPDRPQARRVESLRQTIQRNMLSLPMDEMIRRLGSRFDLRGDLFQQDQNGPENNNNNSNSARESLDRTNTLLTRILSARGLRREQMDMDLNQESVPSPDHADSRRLSSLFMRRTHSHRTNLFDQHQHQIQQSVVAVEDRDSFSSIAAVINSESQMDNAAEIDSLVSLSTSTSRRRSDASRASDLDTGDSRAPRRRRFN